MNGKNFFMVFCNLKPVFVAVFSEIPNPRLLRVRDHYSLNHLLLQINPFSRPFIPNPRLLRVRDHYSLIICCYRSTRFHVLSFSF